MKLFELFYKKMKINFSVENLEDLTRITNELAEFLNKAGIGFYIDFLLKIRNSAEQHDSETFKKLVLSIDIFGDSGALWEVGFDDRQLQLEFDRKFCNYIDILKKMGIKSCLINRVRKLLNNDK